MLEQNLQIAVYPIVSFIDFSTNIKILIFQNPFHLECRSAFNIVTP